MDLDLLLLGKTGVGKSRTGNSILDRKAFVSQPTMDSVTIFSKMDIAEFENGRRIQVVDTPGVGDTGMTKQEGQQAFLTAAREAIGMCPQGYHALLLTFRFASRLTPADKDVLQYLKQVFGEDFIQGHGIIIITHGDTFERSDEIEVSFEEWCRNQTGIFQELYFETKGRVVLFDNWGNEETKTRQREELIKQIAKLGGRKYTNEKFRQAQVAFEKVRVQEGIDPRCEEVKNSTSLVLAQLERFEKIQDVEERLSCLIKLKERIEKHLEFIRGLKETDWLRQALRFNKKTLARVVLEIEQLMIGKELEKRKQDRDKEADIKEIQKLYLQKDEKLSETKESQKKLHETSKIGEIKHTHAG